MAAPNDAFDYDTLADVSQHGSNVFDFLSPPNMFPSASNPTVSSPLQQSPRHHRSHADYPIFAHSIPDISLGMVDQSSPMVTSQSMSLTTPPSEQPILRNTKKKSRSNPASFPGHGFVYPSLLNQAESFCTTDSVAMPSMSVPGVSSGIVSTPVTPKVALTIAKTERRLPVSRSTGALPVLMDASGTVTEAGNSVNSPSTVGGDDGEPGKDVHNSHTRRCRAKVNNKFQELLRILPTPPPKTGVKHKAQILDYTIRVFREIYAKKLYLEAELALSSRAHLNTWVENVVKPATRLADILNPFMSLICTKEKWQFAETWVPVVVPARSNAPADATSQDISTTDPMSTIHARSSMQNKNIVGSNGELFPSPPIPEAPLRLGTTVIPSTGNFDDPDLQTKLERFRDRSRAFVCKPRVDPPGRIMCTMRPEWLPSLTDEEAFQRSALAKDASLSVCFGVPFFVRGHVAAVVVFFDVEQKPYDAKCVDLAGTIAGLLGNAFGARSGALNNTKNE